MENHAGFPIFAAILCLTVFIFIRQRKWKTSKLPPGPLKLPIIGNMLHLIGSLPHHRLRYLANQYGPVMHLQLGQISSIVISSPKAAKQVMKTHDITFANRPSLLLAGIVLYNCKDITFAPYGDYWRQLRKICTFELLSITRVQSFRSIREEEVRDLVSSISSSSGSIINLSKMLFSLSNAITLRAAFGKNNNQKDHFLPLIHKIFMMLEGFSLADIFPSVKFLQVITGMKSRLEKLHEEADKILENIIKEHKESNASGGSDSKGKSEDLVDVLLNLQRDNKLDFRLTTESIKAVMLDMFVGGTETSSTVMEWAMSEMVRNPRVMEKAQAEIRKFFNQKQQMVDETILSELKYLKLVIKETLRMHVPVPLLVPRESKERVEINGYEIPANTKVFINAWAMARDPNHWSDPEEFYPERFLDSSIDYKGNDFEYTPFGAGRRMCPGISYGTAVIELTLANLLYHFDWKVCNGIKPHDLDMSESLGQVARRKNDLQLIPVIYNP